MDKQEIYQQITTLLVKLFEIDEADIKPESRLYEELELDSIDAVDLVVHLQKVTGKKNNARNVQIGSNCARCCRCCR